jgi:hypothetical protein
MMIIKIKKSSVTKQKFSSLILGDSDQLGQSNDICKFKPWLPKCKSGAKSKSF